MAGMRGWVSPPAQGSDLSEIYQLAPLAHFKARPAGSLGLFGSECNDLRQTVRVGISLVICCVQLGVVVGVVDYHRVVCGINLCQSRDSYSPDFNVLSANFRLLLNAVNIRFHLFPGDGLCHLSLSRPKHTKKTINLSLLDKSSHDIAQLADISMGTRR